MVFLAVAGAAAAAIPKTISIDTTGGQCGLIGSWNSSTLTCTLTADYTGTIGITADGITLAGSRARASMAPSCSIPAASQ